MVKDRIRVELDLEQKMCNNCILTDVDYYEYKLQIRANKTININNIINNIKRNLSDIINNIKYYTYENNIGYDILLRRNISYNRISNIISKYYFFESKTSSKLVGYDKLKSKNKYKVTILINIINLSKNENIFYKGNLCKIKSFKKNTLILINNKNNKKYIINYSKNKDYIKKLVDFS